LNPIEDQEFVHYTIDFRRDPCAAQLLQRDVELFDGTAGQGGEEDHFAEEQQGMRNCQGERERERGSTMKHEGDGHHDDDDDNSDLILILILILPRKR